MTTFIIACLLVLNVCFAAIVLKLSLSGFSALTESHERTTKYTEGLVDRLMANDYATYQDRQLSAQMRYDAARAPKPLDDPDLQSTLVMGPDKGGFGSRLGLATPPPDPQGDYEAADLAEQAERERTT